MLRELHEPHHDVRLPVRARTGTRPWAPTASSGRCRRPSSPREYADSDVVLKLSRVEGMFGPPLEGFHMGATCVTTPVTGHDEFIEHGFNGLVVDWDDPRGTARMLDLLARDRRLLHYLRTNAWLTARAGRAGSSPASSWRPRWRRSRRRIRRRRTARPRTCCASPGWVSPSCAATASGRCCATIGLSNDVRHLLAENDALRRELATLDREGVLGVARRSLPTRAAGPGRGGDLAAAGRCAGSYGPRGQG